MQNEMLSLGEAGYAEVTLLGQNVDAYGRDLPGFAQDGALLQQPYCTLKFTWLCLSYTSLQCMLEKQSRGLSWQGGLY